jgi:hypothetical protein
MSDQVEELRQLHRLINDGKSDLEDVKASLAKIANKARLEWTDGNPLVWAVKKNRRDLIKHMVNYEMFKINAISKNCQVNLYLHHYRTVRSFLSSLNETCSM